MSKTSKPSVLDRSLSAEAPSSMWGTRRKVEEQKIPRGGRRTGHPITLNADAFRDRLKSTLGCTQHPTDLLIRSLAPPRQSRFDSIPSSSRREHQPSKKDSSQASTFGQFRTDHVSVFADHPSRAITSTPPYGLPRISRAMACSDCAGKLQGQRGPGMVCCWRLAHAGGMSPS